MGINKNGMAHINLRHLILCLFALALAHNSFAQKLSKYYVSSTEVGGALYFINPQDGFQNAANNNDFIFDITYLTSKDSLTLNFTYSDERALSIDSIGFTLSKNGLKSHTTKLFVERSKRKWEYRYSSVFLFSRLSKFFNQETTPKIELYTDKGIIVLDIKRRKWRKISDITSRIFHLISLNR